MQANRNIHLCQEKSPIYKLSRSKTFKTRQICHYRHARKTSGLYLLHDTGVDFSSSNNFANLDSFAKVSVTVGFIIPWTVVCLKLELSNHVYTCRRITWFSTFFVAWSSAKMISFGFPFNVEQYESSC